jgi:hypothetical protein
MDGLIGMECSGRVRDAFRRRGHNFYSCDLKPCETNQELHIQGDVFETLNASLALFKWWFLGFHPTCTYLCVSGIGAWNKKRPERAKKTEESVEFVLRLVRWLEENKIPRWYIENPVGVLSTRWRKPDQIIQPYQFGEDVSKQTCLWLHGLPLLQPTRYIEPRVEIYKGREVKRWGNQSPCGADNKPPSDSRAADRSRTHQGIANVMAEQWGVL